MTFEPEPGTRIYLNKDESIEFLPLEASGPASVFVYAESGKEGTVYKVLKNQEQYALKVFYPEYRDKRLLENTEKLSRFKELEGFRVAERTVIKPEVFPDLVREYPETRFAVLMPWIEGTVWGNLMLDPDPTVQPADYFQIARTLIRVVGKLESQGLAHCDLSNNNFIIASHFSEIQLIDIEDMYAPDMPRPIPDVSYGTIGYRTPWIAEHGLWGPESDRFSIAVLCSELMTWHNPEIRENRSGNSSFFDEEEIGETSDRYRLMSQYLGEESDELPVLLEKAWFSQGFADCPSVAEWLAAIRKLDPWDVPEPEPAPPMEDQSKITTIVMSRRKFEDILEARSVAEAEAEASVETLPQPVLVEPEEIEAASAAEAEAVPEAEPILIEEESPVAANVIESEIEFQLPVEVEEQAAPEPEAASLPVEDVQSALATVIASRAGIAIPDEVQEPASPESDAESPSGEDEQSKLATVIARQIEIAIPQGVPEQATPETEAGATPTLEDQSQLETALFRRSDGTIPSGVPPKMEIELEILDFGTVGTPENSRQFPISNSGGAVLSVTIQAEGWIDLSHSEFALVPGEKQVITAKLNQTFPSPKTGREYRSASAITVESNAGGEVIGARFILPRPAFHEAWWKRALLGTVIGTIFGCLVLPLVDFEMIGLLIMPVVVLLCGLAGLAAYPKRSSSLFAILGFLLVEFLAVLVIILAGADDLIGGILVGLGAGLGLLGGALASRVFYGVIRPPRPQK